MRRLYRSGATSRDRDRGYTAHPVADEPEAVSADVQDGISVHSRRVNSGRVLDDWRERRERFSADLAWLRSQNLVRDVHAQARTVERLLDRIDERLR